MRTPNFVFCLTLFVFIYGNAYAQTVPADSEPVIKGSTSYQLPRSAIDAGIDGTITVAIRIDESGKPKALALISGPMWPCGSTPQAALNDLSATLSETLMKVEFTPAVKKGKPYETTIGLTFKLKNPNIKPAKVELDQMTGKPKPAMINAGVVNGKAVSLPKPAYPREARMNRDGGAVSIQVVIDEKGNVIRAGAVNGAPSLQFASRDAACGAKFEPTLLQGSPIMVSGVITYNFVP
ncbi:MAG: TonB family protein [Pyrinomonadaceae bacterium]|nr:TonB family protein [Acidobacteriota bacterium]MBK7935271.1 TonB family protein [Acidobacteriota bacterium]MBP7377751.1 TonB family protein [Pyrinomonadaceae bacterium]